MFRIGALYMAALGWIYEDVVLSCQSLSRSQQHSPKSCHSTLQSISSQDKQADFFGSTISNEKTDIAIKWSVILSSFKITFLWKISHIRISTTQLDSLLGVTFLLWNWGLNRFSIDQGYQGWWNRQTWYYWRCIYWIKGLHHSTGTTIDNSKNGETKQEKDLPIEGEEFDNREFLRHVPHCHLMESKLCTVLQY